MALRTPPGGDQAHYAASLHHETTVSSTCNAGRNGHICTARATPDPKGRRLAVCGRHKAQIQPCSSACSAVFRPCSQHEDDAPPCLLQQLPLEVRRMIWAFVVLERPAVEHVSASVQPASESFVGLLRTCRWISDEASEVLYERMRFKIGVSMAAAMMGPWYVTPVSVAMCRGWSSMEVGSALRPWDEWKTRQWAGGPSDPGGHALHDYAFQLHLLELENERRVQRNHSHVELKTFDPRIKMGRDLEFWTWQPPMEQSQFNRIRHIEMVLEVCGSQSWNQSQHSPYPYIQQHLSEQVDILHKVVNRLLFLDQPLRRLTIEIRFIAFSDSTAMEFYLEATKTVLRPFMRLNIQTRLRSICTAPRPLHKPTELGGDEYNDFLRDWQSALAINVDAYEKALASFMQYYLLILGVIDAEGRRDGCIEEPVYNALARRTLPAARAAREAADAPALDRIRADVRACLCALRAGCARSGHYPPAPAPALPPRWGPGDEQRPRAPQLAELGAPFAELLARTPWPEGLPVERGRAAQAPPRLWLRTEYPSRRLRHMWAAADFISG